MVSACPTRGPRDVGGPDTLWGGARLDRMASRHARNQSQMRLAVALCPLSLWSQSRLWRLWPQLRPQLAAVAVSLCLLCDTGELMSSSMPA